MAENTLDNTTPLRKKDLQNPTVVQAVESLGANTDSIGTSHPQGFPESSAAEVKNANTPVLDSTSRAGGKSEPAEGGAGGPGHGGAPGGAKGIGGATATAGGPFQSESGQTLETGKDYLKEDPAT